MQSDDGVDVLFPNPIGGPAPPELAAGNPEDDQLLSQIAARASLSQPRSWRHYVTSLMPGAEYDGWEVSISEDEYLDSGL